jgi:chondroitin AC lyase
LLIGTIQVNGEKLSGKRTTLKNPKWIKQDGIGYIFPKETQVELKADFQKGNLQRIYGLGKDTVYSTEVFSLWFNHGKNPKDAGYQYIVVPGVSDEYLSEYIKNVPVDILLNTKQVQAVHHKKLNLLSLVFYEKGEFEHEDTLIKIDAPCLVLVDWNRNEISVSDPTQELSEIEVLVQTKDKTLIDKKIKLPSHGFAGKSHTLKMN